MSKNDRSDTGHTLIKLAFSFLTWSSLVLVAIVFNTGDGLIIPILLFMGFFLVLINGFIWDWGQGVQHRQQRREAEEKRKRDMLDSVLRNMSNEQLMALRTRLSDPDFDDDLKQMLGDDGEYIIDQL